MAELKTGANDGDVRAFLDGIDDEEQRKDAQKLLELMGRVSGAEPVMYGSSIVGFGRSEIRYANGKTEPWFAIGFSPRKGKLSLYIVDDPEEHRDLLDQMGPYKNGRSCIWVKRLRDVDMQVLEDLLKRPVAEKS
jgi:hypothetical protein